MGGGGAVVPIVLSTFVKRLCASASCTRRCARCGNGRNKTAPGAEVRRDAARQRRRPRAPGRTSALFGARRGAASGPALLPSPSPPSPSPPTGLSILFLPRLIRGMRIDAGGTARCGKRRDARLRSPQPAWASCGRTPCPEAPDTTQVLRTTCPPELLV